MVSHPFVLIHTQGRFSSQDLLLVAIVSGVVNQVFPWLRASFTLAGFHCRRRLAKEAWESAGALTGLPGPGQSQLARSLLRLGHLK